MFILVIYKDPAELSTFRPRTSDSRTTNSPTESHMDLGQEKVLLVNPDCYVRVMLEYIRKACKLAPTTQFDLCDDTGKLENLFNYPTFSYCSTLVSRKSYYLIVIRVESPKEVQVFPQVNRENKVYLDLQNKVRKNFLATCEKPEKQEGTAAATVTATTKTVTATTKSANSKKK